MLTKITSRYTTFTLSLSARLSHVGSTRQSLVAAVAALLGTCRGGEISVWHCCAHHVIPVSVTSLSCPNILQSADDGDMKYVKSRGG